MATEGSTADIKESLNDVLKVVKSKSAMTVAITIVCVSYVPVVASASTSV